MKGDRVYLLHIRDAILRVTEYTGEGKMRRAIGSKPSGHEPFERDTLYRHVFQQHEGRIPVQPTGGEGNDGRIAIAGRCLRIALGSKGAAAREGFARESRKSPARQTPGRIHQPQAQAAYFTSGTSQSAHTLKPSRKGQ